MDEEVKEKTIFISRFGTFKFEVMPFGLINVPSRFQRLMDKVFMDVPYVRVYLDKVFIFYSTLEGHMQQVSFVLKRIAAQGMKIKATKGTFEMHEVEFLGHIVEKDDVTMNDAKFVIIVKVSRLTNQNSFEASWDWKAITVV